MLIDTHAHVNFTGFKDDYKDVLTRAKQAGVLVVNVGTQLDTSASAVKMAEDFGLYAVVGLHPVHTYSQHVDEEESHFKTREEKFDYEAYKALALNPRVVGIGECGLDYYRLPTDIPIDGHHTDGAHLEGAHLKIDEIKRMQEEAFRLQVRLAKEVNKALVIHCRPSEGTQDAYQDILKVLDEEGCSDLRFEIHSFTGSPEIVQEFLKRGAYVGFNGIVTFDKTGNMARVLETVPLDRIVLETDCPYLTPAPHRGKKNEPAYVEYVAQKVADNKGLTLLEISQVTSENSKTLFALE